jgi:hypothetical protein
MKSVTVVDNPVRGGELGRRRDIVEYSLPEYVATTDDQFFEIVAVAGHAGAVLAPRLAIGAVEDTARGVDALWRHYSNIACVSRQP